MGSSGTEPELCLKDNTTQRISPSLVEVAPRPWEEHISPKFPEPPHALFPPESLLLFPRYQSLFSAFRSNEVWVRQHNTYLTTRQTSFWRPSTKWKCRALLQTLLWILRWNQAALTLYDHTVPWPYNHSTLGFLPNLNPRAETRWLGWVVQIKKQIFFFSQRFKHCCENGCHFTFKRSGKIRFLESLIDQSCSRFFIIEIVTLDLYMPLILTEPLIRQILTKPLMMRFLY